VARLKPRTGELDAYIRAGFQLIPLNFYDVTDSKGRARGKSPLHGQWQKKEYDNASVVKLAEQGYNVGVRLTAEVMVLDVDPRNFPEGRDSLAELVKDARLDLSTCPHTITGSGGDHFWFRKPVDVSILDSLPDYQGVEFKSRGRQVVASGSVHPNGTYYEWDDFAPAMTDLPDLPHTLLSLIRRAQKSQGEAAGYGEMDSERLEQTLALLDPSEFRDHEGWLNLMMACHHATAGEGRQEFIDWSTSDPAFIDHGREVGYRWDSLDKPRSGGRPVTIKYLYKVVQERGLEVPPVPPEEDFDVWDDVEEGDGVDTDKLGQEPERTPLDEMNEKHACVSDNGKFRIVTWEQDPVLKRRYITKSTKGDFIDVYGNRLIETPAGGASMLGKWWLAHPMRRQYRGIIFDPSRDHEGWLNLWEGWAYTPKKGDWSIMQELCSTCSATAPTPYLHTES
jgi:hypothetical protein